jgi:hypothetical protein
MNTEELIIKTLKDCIIKEADWNGHPDEIKLKDRIDKYMDSLDFAQVTIEMDCKLKLDSNIINSDPALHKAKTLKDLVKVYVENYNGTVYDE